MIQIKRIYEPAEDADGLRILVDRIWPRGISRFDARIDHWEKEVAPTSDLRKWFGHKPERWVEFRKRYRAELKTNPALAELRQQIGKKRTTLLYSARDTERNQAVVLCGLLNEMSGKGTKAPLAKKAAPAARKPRAKAARSASPVCYAEDADPAYMGYLTREELVTFLTEMLVMVQASMRATREMGKQAPAKKARTRMALVQQDESRWYATLLGALHDLGAASGPRKGETITHATATPDPKERIVCRLKETLPGIQSDGLYHSLRAMLEAYENIIQLTAAPASGHVPPHRAVH